MSLSLHDQWIQRLAVAQAASSWQSRIEARVLRFLLARYAGSDEATPLTKISVYEGELPYGRAHVPLSARQLKGRLTHIAHIADERPVETLSTFEVAWEKRNYEAAKRRRRYNMRHERGYW